MKTNFPWFRFFFSNIQKFKARKLVLLFALCLLLSNCRTLGDLRYSLAGRDLIKLEALGGETIDLAELSQVQLRGFSVADFNKPAVKRQLKLYLKRKRAVEKLLSRAAFYLPMVTKIFKEEGVPTDLGFLPLVESGFNPHAVSSSKATGLWQFMYTTGKIYGLNASYWSDERRDVVRSSRAAAKHLRYLFKVFNNWPLALAAYNAGVGRISRGMKRSGTKSFWQLAATKTLKKETIDYVPRFIALATIAKNPSKYGFAVPKVKPLGELKSYTVEDATEVRLLAKSAGLSELQFRSINPAISQWSTPPGEDFNVYIPKDKYEIFFERFGKTPANKRVTFRRYFVSIGDNLSTIAEKFDVPISPIVKINGFTSLDDIKAGKFIVIPIQGLKKAKNIASDEMRSTKKTVRQTETSVLSRYSSKKVREDAFLYAVKPADSLYVIARRYSVGLRDLMEWNGLQSPESLQEGTHLYIRILP